MPAARVTPAAFAACLVLGAFSAVPAFAQTPTASPTPTPTPTPALTLVPTATPTPAPSGPPRIPAGVTAGGIEVGGLTVREARLKLKAVANPVLARDISIQAGKRTFRLKTRSIRLKHDARRSAQRALRAGAAVSAISPDGPRIPVAVPLAVSYRADALSAFLQEADRRFYVAPRDARIRITLKRVFRRPSRPGRDLNWLAVQRQVKPLLREAVGDRRVRARRTLLRPNVRTKDLRRTHHTILTVDRRNFRLRLFKNFKTAKTYRVAVGAAGYETPTGLYSITNKAVNPAWSAPDKPWAGLYRGRTIPGGAANNPLKARWLGIVNGVGIHGTGDPGSIGSRASHGCIRMTVSDVKDLYPRVPVGTPVLIG